MADGKARRLTGNVAIASGLIAIGLLIASRWITVRWSEGTPGWSFSIAGGDVRVAHWSSKGGALPVAGWTSGVVKHPSGPDFLHVNQPDSFLGLVFVTRWNGFGVVGTEVSVLPMIPAMGLVLAGFGLRWWGRRALGTGAGECATCGYAVVGLAPGAKCPECGNPTRPATNRSSHAKHGV